MKHQFSFSPSAKRVAWGLGLVMAASLIACGGGGGGGGNGFGSATAAGAGTGVGGAGRGPSPVDLGLAGPFTILAQSAITSVPTSVINGDLGLSPAAGSNYVLTCAEVATGTIYTASAGGPACETVDAARLTNAINAKNTAYTDAAGRAPDYIELGTGRIGGFNLGPATYKWSTPVTITSDVKLTGGANDVWIFEIAQGLSISSGVKVILEGGALPQNIYWQVVAAADMGTTSVFKGTILSQTSIAMKTGSAINGKLFAGTAVTLDQSKVNWSEIHNASVWPKVIERSVGSKGDSYDNALSLLPASTSVTFFKHSDSKIQINLHLVPIASLIAGILSLLVPRLLDYIVAIYLIIIDIISLLGTGSLHRYVEPLIA
jgi:hypothetical protein